MEDVQTVHTSAEQCSFSHLKLRSSRLKLKIIKNIEGGHWCLLYMQPFVEKTVESCTFTYVSCSFVLGHPILKMGVRKYQSARNKFVFVYGCTLKLYLY